MYYPILLSLIAAAAGVPAQSPEPTIRVTLSNDGEFLPGDRSKVQVITRDDGYLLVFQVDPDGHVRVLFPLDPTDDNFVRGGRHYQLLGRGAREGFTVDAPGRGAVFAAVSLAPWRFNGYVQNGHWDFRALNATAIDDPEPQLVNLAQTMAGGRFDYDIVGYSVASPVAASSDFGNGSAGAGAINDCFGCGGVTVVAAGGWGVNPWGWNAGWGWGPAWGWNAGWGWGPAWGWNAGWGWNNSWVWGPGAGWWGPGWGPGPGWNNGCCWGGGWGQPVAVPFSPYQRKPWNQQWSGTPVPYRPRGVWGFSAPNSVAGVVPGSGVAQQASFRNRRGTDDAAAAPVAQPQSRRARSSAEPVTVPVSRTAPAQEQSPAKKPAAREPKGSEPELRRREPPRSAPRAAPAQRPAASPPSAPRPEAAPAAAAPPAAVSGGGRRR
jgi:hypothetical protein